MTNERDELQAVIFPVLDRFLGYRGGYPADVDGALADAIMDAGYRKNDSWIDGDTPMPGKNRGGPLT